MTVLVSAYYKIPSKAPHSRYVPWLQRFFRSVKAPVVFFTTADVGDEIQSWGISANFEIVILPFDELRAWRLGRDFWNRQKARDPEAYHTPELAAVWYEKKEFVARAMEMRPAENLFIWCDAGCVRDDACEAAAASFGCRPVTWDDGRLHLEQVSAKNISKEYYTYPLTHIAGGFQAGNRAAWEVHSLLYDNTLAEYDNAEVSCNSDQYIITSCKDRNPALYSLHVPHNSQGGGWFWFIFNF